MPKNRYVPRGKISEAKFRQFLRYFSLDMEATKIAVLTGLNRNTVNRLAKLVRARVASESEREVASELTPETQATPHGQKRFGERLVFGWVLSGGRIRVLLKDSRVRSASELSLPSGTGFSSALLPSQTEALGPARESRSVPTDTTSVRLLDYFWSNTRLRMAKFKGTSQSTFELHLKECEFRFNHRREDLYAILLKLLRERRHPEKISQN